MFSDLEWRRILTSTTKAKETTNIPTHLGVDNTIEVSFPFQPGNFNTTFVRMKYE